MSSEAALTDRRVEELAYQALLCVGLGASYWEVQRAVEGAIREAALIIVSAAAKAGRDACPLCGKPWEGEPGT